MGIWRNTAGNEWGISMHLKVGGQGPFHYWSLSAPYIIGPENPKTYWFDPDTARKVLDSPTTKITFTTRNATRPRCH